MNDIVEEKIKRYIRYVTIFITLEGFTMEQTAYDLMFGYTDPFLDDIKHNYPPFGGDPSVQSKILFNDPNITKEEASMKI